MSDQSPSNAKGFAIMGGVLAVGAVAYFALRDSGSSDDGGTGFLGALLLVGFVCGLIGAAVSNGKRMGGGAAFWCGFLLGPIGILIVAVSESATARPDGPPLGSPTQRLSVPPPAPGTAAGWLPDPTTRFQHRYWDGGRWTEHVHNGTTQHTDPI